MRIDLKTGFGCNNRCTFCVQGDRRQHEPDRGTEELLAVLVQARAHGDEVVLTGGECTIRADILPLIRAARDLGYRSVQLQSNGRRFSVPSFCDAVIEAGATEFSPALHGATAATHDAQTRAPGSFRQTVLGIRNLVARRQVVITNSVVTRGNLDELPALIALLVGLRVHQAQLAMVHPLGTAAARFDEVVPRLEEAAPRVAAAVRLGRRAGLRVMVEAMPPCFLPGLEDCLSEPFIPQTRIEDVGRVVPDFTAARVGQGKAKGPPCEECTWDPACEGPWREYPAHHGWQAHRPRRDPPLRSSSN